MNMNMRKALSGGIAGSFFFAFTFILNRSMHHFNGSRAPRRADNPLSPAGVRS